MSYTLYDSNGYLAEGPSTQGLEDLYEWAEKDYPDIAQFISEGYLTDLERLIATLDGATADGSVESSRVALLDAARKAQDILILSDGTSNAVPHTLARRKETAVHVAADAHVKSFKALFLTAFAAGRDRINKKTIARTNSPSVVERLLESSIKATEIVLHSQLEQKLLKCLKDGGDAAIGMLE